MHQQGDQRQAQPILLEYPGSPQTVVPPIEYVHMNGPAWLNRLKPDDLSLQGDSREYNRQPFSSAASGIPAATVPLRATPILLPNSPNFTPSTNGRNGFQLDDVYDLVNKVLVSVEECRLEERYANKIHLTVLCRIVHTGRRGDVRSSVQVHTQRGYKDNEWVG